MFSKLRVFRKNQRFLLTKWLRFASYKGNEYTPIIMPKLSPTATESKVEEWNVKEGDYIEAGDPYCTIETDKASLSHDATENGYIARLFKSDGMIPINSMIGVQVEEEEQIANFKSFTPADFANNSAEKTAEKNDEKTTEKEIEKDVKKDIKTVEKKTISAEKEEKSSETAEKRIKATPLAKKIAEKNEIDLSKIASVKPSGMNGVFVEKDVRKLVAEEKTETAGDPIAGGRDIPLTAMRATIAKRLLESKTTIPHFDLNLRCKMDRLIRYRKDLNEISPVKISINDLIIKASAMALKDVPEVNSSFMGSFIREHHSVDISVAVSTPKGLLTPIVKDADKKGLKTISSEIKSLASKAREGKLTPPEFIGGTFTISNLGMMGVESFSAIINPPQSAILAVGSTRDELQLNKEKEMIVVKMMAVNLACDHRVVDGAKGADWLVAFKKYIENPISMAL